MIKEHRQSIDYVVFNKPLQPNLVSPQFNQIISLRGMPEDSIIAYSKEVVPKGNNTHQISAAHQEKLQQKSCPSRC